MLKTELINIIYDYFNSDLASIQGESPTIKDLEALRESQLWVIAIDLELLGDELL